MSKKAGIAEVVFEFLEKYLKSLNKSDILIYDVVFEKEGASYFLKVFIEKENENISFEDCEKISKALSLYLDENDFISQSYFLQVSSPGIERHIRTNEHFQKYIGKYINVTLIRPYENLKNFVAKLLENNKEEILLMEKESLKEFLIKKANIASVKLYYDFDNIGESL